MKSNDKFKVGLLSGRRIFNVFYSTILKVWDFMICVTSKGERLYCFRDTESDNELLKFHIKYFEKRFSTIYSSDIPRSDLKQMKDKISMFQSQGLVF